ncbi:MAG: hypothetical protein MJZ20_02735 [Bacteroidaceae bacterium]|nr:hypothetical protein [Bacteroidaceae bacterium]
MNDNENLDLQTQEQIADVVAESPAVSQTTTMPTQGQYDAVKEYNKRVEEDYAARPVVKAGTEGYIGTNEYNAEVTPFKVNVYGEEFSINSIDPRKAAYDIMTKYKGYPEDYYLGYSYVPSGLSDGIASNLLHGAAGLVASAPNMLAGTGELISDVISIPLRAAEQVGFTPAKVLTQFVDRTNANNYKLAQEASSWLYNELDLEPFDTTFSGRLTRAIGAGAASVGAVIASGNPAIATAVMNAGSYSNIKRSLMDSGVNPLMAMGVATGGYAAIAALDTVSNTAIFNATKGITPKVAGNVMKEMALAKGSKAAAIGRGVGAGLLDMAQEGVTEELQNKIEEVLSGELGFDNYQNFFTSEDAITFLSSFLVGAVALPGNILNEVKARDLSILENYKANAQVADFLGRTQDAKKFLKETLGFTEEESVDFLNRMMKNGTDAVLEELNNATREQIAKAKFDPEKVKRFYDAYKKLVESGGTEYVNEEEWLKLDEAVERAMTPGWTSNLIPSFDGSDLLLAKALFRGMAANVLYKTGMTIPEFIDRYVSNFDFNVETSLENLGSINRQGTQINVSPTLSKAQGSSALAGISKDYTEKLAPDAIKKNADKDISARHGTLMHEMMHKFHTIINDSFNSQDATEILDSMLTAVETVFGAKNAEAVKKAADDKFGWNKAGRYAGEQNTTEWIAQATKVLGEKMLDVFGVRGEAAEYLSFLHIMLGTANRYTILPEALQNYINSVEKISKENGERLVAMAKDYGVDKLSVAAQRVIDSGSADINWQGITEDVIKELYDVSKMYVDGKGAEVINGIFKTPGMYDDFINVADRYFNKSQAIVREATAETQKSIAVYDKAIKAGEKMIAKIDKKIATLEEKLNKTTDEDERNYIMGDLSALYDQRDSKIQTIQSLENGITEESTKGIAKRIDGIANSLSYDDIVAEMEGETEDAYRAERRPDNIFADRGDQVTTESAMAMQDATDAENKATGKTPFQRQVETKVDGKTLQEDIEYVSNVLSKEEDRTPLGRFYKWLLGMADRFGISEFVRAIGGKEMEDRFGLIAKHEALDDITYAKHERFSNRVQKEVLGLDKTKEANVSAKLQQFETECSLKQHEVDYADPRDGHVSKRKLSAFELMMVYLVGKQDKRMTDPNGLEVGLSPKERLQESLPNQSVDELVKLLTPEQKKYADIMQEEMGKAFQSFISSFEDAGLGTKFATVENYWPLLDAMAQAEGKDNTNWTIARDAFATSAIGIMDAREQFNRYIARVASFESGFYAAIGRLKDVFFYTPRDIGSTNEVDQKLASDLTNQSKRAQAAMERRIGKKASDVFNGLMKDFLSPRAENLLSDSVVAKISRNLTTQILSWKPIQLLKASANFFSFWGLAENQGQYWADTVEGISNPAETWKFMMEHSPQIKKRLRGLSYSEFLNSTTAGGDNLLAVLAKEGAERDSKILSKNAPALANFIALSNVMKKYGLSPMLMGDAFSNVYGGYALYKQYLRKYNGDIEMATRAFDEAIIRRQASSNQAMKSLKQRQWNRSLAGAFLAFSSEGIAKWNDMIIKLEQAHEGEISKGEAAMSVASSVTSMLAFSLLSIGMADLLFGDDDEREGAYDSILPEIISQVSGASLLGNAFVAPAVNQLLLGGKQGASIALANEIFSFMRSANKGELDSVGLRTVSATGLFLGAENLLSDFAGVGRAVTAEDRKERQAGIAQAEGRSKSWAERREGIKKTVEKDSEE